MRGRWEGGLVSTDDAIYHDVIPDEPLIYSYEMWLDEKRFRMSFATLRLRVEGKLSILILTDHGAFLDRYDDAGSRKAGTARLLDALEASLHG